MYACVLPECCVSGARGSQKRASGSPELESGRTVSCHVGLGNPGWVFCKSNKCSQPLSHPSRPSYIQSCKGHSLTYCKYSKIK